MKENLNLFKVTLGYSKMDEEKSEFYSAGQTTYFISASSSENAEKMALEAFKEDYNPSNYDDVNTYAKQIKTPEFIELKGEGILNL